MYIKRVEVSLKIVNVLEKEISKLELPNYNKIFSIENTCYI